MTLIIDTYNVLHVTGVLPPDLAGLEVPGLAALIAMSRYGGEAAWLICDGVGRAIPLGTGTRVSVRFSGPGRAADDEIERMIEHSTAPRRLSVVSSDRRIRQAARRRRCSWLRSEEFLSRLAMDARAVGGLRAETRRNAVRPPVPLARQDVERWIDRFGIDAALLSLPPSRPASTSADRGQPIRIERRPGPAKGVRSDEGPPRSSDVRPQTGKDDATAAAPASKAPSVALDGLADCSVEGQPPRRELDQIGPRDLDDLDRVDFESIMRAALEAIPERDKHGRGERGRGQGCERGRERGEASTRRGRRGFR